MKTFDKKSRHAFTAQRHRAERRGILFEFTYDEWLAWWWKHLGEDWIWKRGPYKNQYCMARYYDDGPYAPHNVKCITNLENAVEAQRHKSR